jgi:hypothetical protein
VTLPILGWQEVIYSPQDQEELCKKVLHHIATTSSYMLQRGAVYNLTELEVFKDCFKLAIYYLLPFLKHSGFSEEREVRAIFTRDAEQFHELYRVSRGRLTAYLNVTTNLNIVDPPRVNTIPILAIRCSPSSLPGSEQLVRNLLKSKGYEGVEVTKSEIPFLS